MVNYIYFDFGGVLVNYERVFQKVCSDFDLDFDNFLEFYDQFDRDLAVGKITTESFWKKCIENYNLTNADDYDLVKSWVSDYDIIRPINRLIHNLEDKIKIGIISNINSEIWEAALADGWVPKINYSNVLLSYQVGLTKPDKQIYLEVQKATDSEAAEILFIDDQEKNLVIPQQLGWRTILFDRFKAEEGVRKIREMIS